MAHYDGETLAQIFRRGPLPVAVAAESARQVALGLAEAHSKGMIHRDIKPGNVMIARGNLVKALDFGLARILEHYPERDLRGDACIYVLGASAGARTAPPPDIVIDGDDSGEPIKLVPIGDPPPDIVRD